MADLDNNAGENIFKAIDIDTTKWDLSHNSKFGVDLGRLMLRKDPDSDAEIRMLRYPKGVLNPEHTHPGGHGIFVLEANFRRIMEHMDPELGYGSRRARLSSTEQLTKATWLVFFTDGAFEIHYKDDE